jgi:exopolysaccharide biosynthesis polyprenyl glycosylphosphotransferase
MSLKKDVFSISKFLFKTSFAIGLLLLEQVSFIISIYIIYNNDFEMKSLMHYIYCLPIMIVGSIVLLDYFKLSFFQRKPVQTVLLESFKFVAILIATICVFAYVFNLSALSRYVLVLGGVFLYIFVFIWIEINQKISIRMYEKGKMLIVANHESEADKIMAKIMCEARSLNLDILGWLTPAEVISQHKLFLDCSEVLISNDVDEKDKSEVLILCSNHYKAVYIVPSFYDLTFSKYKIVKFYDTPTFYIENSGLTFQQQLLKRIFDILFSLIALVLTSPLYLIIAILIKLDSPGQIFYTQDRVTTNGEIYKVIKFRTMVANAEKIFGAFQSSEDDPRVTRIGKFLRNSHLDELPQFVNVLLGSMSVVGPRSDRAITVDMLEKQAIGYNYRLKVKSGITGLAQLFGKYNSDPEDKLRYDIYYIKNYSLLMDLQIILLSFSVFMPRSDIYNKMKSSSDYYISNDHL